MFTGLIEGQGEIMVISDHQGITRFDIKFPVDLGAGRVFSAKVGDSVSINGACLTVVSVDEEHRYSFDVTRETLERTGFYQLKPGSRVNFERAMEVGSRLGGHMVLGHVDATAELLSKAEGPDGWLFQVKVSHPLQKYLIEKGSICLDGVSLTINKLCDEDDGSIVDLMLIPLTLDETTFGLLQVGWHLNLEVDVYGKYVERLAMFDSKG